MFRPKNIENMKMHSRLQWLFFMFLQLWVSILFGITGLYFLGYLFIPGLDLPLIDAETVLTLTWIIFGISFLYIGMHVIRQQPSLKNSPNLKEDRDNQMLSKTITLEYLGMQSQLTVNYKEGKEPPNKIIKEGVDRLFREAQLTIEPQENPEG